MTPAHPAAVWAPPVPSGTRLWPTGSRLGVTLAEWQQAYEQEPVLLSLLDGFHFHTLCEQNADALLVTLKAVEEKFGPYLAGKKWINFGGGHHITRTDYDVPALEGAIRHMQEKYGLLVYLEPGEAVALNAGYLYTTVLEVQEKSAAKTACANWSAQDVFLKPHRTPLHFSAI